MEKTEAWYEEIFEKLPACVFVSEVEDVDALESARIIWANKGLTSVLGFAPEELVEAGADWYKLLVYHEDYSIAIKTLQDILVANTEATYISLIRANTKDGWYKLMNCRSIIFKRKEDGSPLQILNVGVELNDSLSTERQLEAIISEIIFKNVQLRIKHITKREKEILGLIVKGLTDKKIADILFISERTAQTHRNNLIKKAGVSNTAALVALTLGKEV